MSDLDASDMAKKIVSRLNNGDPDKVILGYANPEPREQRRAAIARALPAPGCRYTILQVRDLGERPDRLHPIYRFEIEVMQRCQDGTPESNRTIGLELVPDMGDWVPWKVIP
ncbi:hypothetical protein [Nocardia sp. CC201C]|uniref:hypothetical protein n=1 Tax=Nocardia sp. CC201C TaxID=3044575 RepID=UPI0024A866D6|nr:hypothetical protein [Nocardia sp. CC201C]